MALSTDNHSCHLPHPRDLPWYVRLGRVRPDTASCSGDKDRRERAAGCPPSTLVGPLREGSSEEEPRFVVGFFSVTASNLVQLVRLHEIGARLSSSSVCGAATWPYQENPDMTGLRGANAIGYLRRCRVTAP